MSEDRSQWWAALAGLTALVAVLGVLSIGMLPLDTRHHVHRDMQLYPPDIVMRLMSGD
jgi:hypothetical protein